MWRVLGFILGVALLAPGLCGAIAVPDALSMLGRSQNNGFVELELTLGGIGLLLGAIGVWLIYTLIRRR